MLKKHLIFLCGLVLFACNGNPASSANSSNANLETNSSQSVESVSSNLDSSKDSSITPSSIDSPDSKEPTSSESSNSGIAKEDEEDTSINWGPLS